MKCRAEGCENDAVYKKEQLCQKHYFRQKRYGTTELTRPKAVPLRSMDERGYILAHDPSHALAYKNGYVYEHRKVVFDILGPGLRSCALCGARVTWETVHIDHIDSNPSNNKQDNLRPLCRACNVQRSYPERHEFRSNHAITLGGVTFTAQEWSRLTNGFLSGSTIARRIKAGMCAEKALFSAKKTHGKGEMPPYTHAGLIEIARHYRAEARRLWQIGPIYFRQVL